MSTIFEVFPASRANVRFGEVIELAQVYVNTFLADLEIDKQIEFRAELIGKSKRRDAKIDEVFQWPRETYVWISVHDILGGTDVYCDTIKHEDDADDPWWVLDELKAAPNYSSALDARIESACKHNTYWSFRRSAGQPAIIAVAYGLIATSLAELTDGLIYSGDNAWDFKAFPATGSELRSIYFKPEATREPDRADWVERCIASLRGGEF